MAVFVRAKHVTAPLDERVRARLRGEFTNYASSGSDHDGTASTSDDPSCFSALLNGFLDSDANDGDDPDRNKDSDSEVEYSSTPMPINSTLALAGKLRDLLSPPPSADPTRSRVISDVESAASEAATLRLTGSAFRRAVMGRLRERGYNAGICKARWDVGGGLTAGSYEYIDVVFLPAGEADRRYIVDLGFAAEFEVARATEEYVIVAAALPAVVVARPEEIRSAVRIMAEAARRSLKSRGMSVPPWRKKRHMMAKWLGFYRRTVNSFGVVVERGGEGEVRWRAVGFGCGGEN
ncbi:hypothetical protein M5K25_025077 [Dendrobium thyrsiflorum]|uniref:DUF506 family protein n=1 Tax=Dendrobium thyrsiflorum TaxID=117978 RepID=A0ABD0U3R9_DENTH